MRILIPLAGEWVIYADGSGQVGQRYFEPGTYDFSKVVQVLKQSSTTQPASTGAASFRMIQTPGESSEARYVADWLLVNRILMGLPEPPAPNSKYLAVTAADGREIWINENGSAAYGFGSAVNPRAMPQVPAGVFDFDDLVRRIEASTTVERRSPKDAGVVLPQSVTVDGMRVMSYCNDHVLIESLFETAKRTSAYQHDVPARP